MNDNDNDRPDKAAADRGPAEAPCDWSGRQHHANHIEGASGRHGEAGATGRCFLPLSKDKGGASGHAGRQHELRNWAEFDPREEVKRGTVGYLDTPRPAPWADAKTARKRPKKRDAEPAALSKPAGSAPRVHWGDMAKGRAIFYHSPMRIMRPMEERTEKAARTVELCLKTEAARRRVKLN